MNNFNLANIAGNFIKDVAVDLFKPSTKNDVYEKIVYKEPKIDVNITLNINIYTSGLGEKTRTMSGQVYIDQYIWSM